MQQEPYKYWAFISYSHRDQAWADWLHKALETYRVPRRLVGRETAAGPVPRRLFPVFRDLEELPSSPNLSGAIDQALEQSRTLIVIASPYAAVSKWVDQEIARFRAMGRGDRILCLIVDGEPHADLQPGKGYLECFPPSLRTEDGIEPIAADVRPEKDSKPAAKLKLIAGLLGVGLDELRRRERRRRLLQNVGGVTFSLLSATALAGLWQMQQREKHEALAQQALRTHIETVYEKGRQELIAHNQARAAVYLNEAYRLGVDTPALRFMLARAMRVVEMEKLSFQTGAPVSSVRFSPDSKLLVTVGDDRIAQVWQIDTQKKLIEFSLASNGRSLQPHFSRDGRLVYTLFAGYQDSVGLLKVWDVSSGKELIDLPRLPNMDHAFNSFDYDTRYVAQVAPDHSVRIVELATGKELRRIADAPYSVAGFSRDGKFLLTGGEDGELAVWDGQGRARLQVLHGLHSAVVALDDAGDGHLLVAAARDGSIRGWRRSDGGVQLVAGHPSPNPSLILNPDGARLLTKAADGARVWDTDSGQLVYVQQFSGANGNTVDFSSSGRWVLSSSSSRLAMQDAQSGAELFTLDAHRGLPQARDIGEDDRSLVTGGPDGRVVLWEMPQIPNFEYRHTVDPVAWAAETRRPAVAAEYSHSGELIATGAGDGNLKIWDVNSHSLLREMDGADTRSVNLLQFSADDRRLLSGGYADGVKLWDVQSGRLLRRFDCEGRWVLAIWLSSDGRTAGAALLGGVTWLWDVDSGERIAAFDRDEPRGGGFSPDGRRFAIGMQQSVRLWDLDRRAFAWSVPFDFDPVKAGNDVSALDFSPDGRWIAVTGTGRSAAVIDAASGRVEQRQTDPSAGSFNAVRFAHHGQLIAMSDRNGIAEVWRTDDDRLRTLRGQAGEVRTIEFSPDDAFVLTSGADALARIWDTVNGNLLDTVAEHSSEMPQAPFHAARFSPDGNWILTGSIDGAVREWQVRREIRSPQQIDAILRCKVPWRLDQENLVSAAPDAAACSRRE